MNLQFTIALALSLSIYTSAVAESPVFVDLNDREDLHVVVDREEGQYLGHPTTCLLDDGKTILCVYPKGHGRGAIMYKRSVDGGRTWSQRIKTPSSWQTSREVPTLHRVEDAAGVKRIIMWSGLYPARMAVSDDDGDTWSELITARTSEDKQWGGIVVMGFVEAINDAPGRYIAMFHDDGRFFANSGQKGPFQLYQTLSNDGGLTWSFPVSIFKSSAMHLCEPGCIRSPDGKTLAVLLRENSRRHNSQIIFSQDEGQTWSAPKALPMCLTGDRHTAKYDQAGNLLISFRCISPTAKAEARRFEGDWVAWLGSWDNLQSLAEETSDSPADRGQFIVRLKDNRHNADTAYPGVEILPDGTFVITTYGHWDSNKEPYIRAVRFRTDDLTLAASPH